MTNTKKRSEIIFYQLLCVRVGLGDRMTFPFASTSHYDPKQHPRYSYYDVVTRRKFCGTSCRDVIDLKLHVFCVKMAIFEVILLLFLHKKHAISSQLHLYKRSHKIFHGSQHHNNYISDVAWDHSET